MKRVNIYITPQQEKELRDLSGALGIKRSTVVRNAIDEFKLKYDDEIEDFLKGFEQRLFDHNYNPTVEQQFVKTCEVNKKYFIENVIKINTVDRGLIPFELREYQSKLIDVIDNYNEVIINKSRQIGMTKLAAAIITHYLMFNNHKLVYVGANKLSRGVEIIKLIRDMIMAMPEYLRPHMSIRNNHCIEIEGTKSKVILGTTTRDSIVGFKPDFIYIDEAAFIRKPQFDGFLDALKPLKYQPKMLIASSTNGFNTFCKLWYDALCNYNNLRPVKIPYHLVPRRDERWKRDEIQRIGLNRFNAEYNCEFIDEERYAF